MNSSLKRRALFPAVAMALASVVALSSVSYAWFTMGNTADLGKLDVKVKAASGMQISMDGIAWKSSLTTEEIKGDLTAYTGNVNQFPSVDMMPVSTAGKVTTGKLDMFKGTIDNAKLTAIKETDAKGTGGNYFAFDLFFKMSGANEIFLESGSEVAFSAIDKGTQLSSRVAFLDLGAASTPEAAKALQGASLAAADYIWEPNALKRATGALNSGATDSIKLDYKGVNAAISTGIDPNGSDTQLTTVATKSPTTFGTGDTDAKILNLEEGINKVRVYIWVEGQDIDCGNDVSVDGIATTLKFVQKETTKTT